MRHPTSFAFAVLLGVASLAAPWTTPCAHAAAAPSHPAAAIAWPAGDLSRRVQAYCVKLQGGEDAARTFFIDNYSASALAQAPVETRLERRRGMLASTGGLTPLEVVDVEDASLAVRCRTGTGDEMLATFD